MPTTWIKETITDAGTATSTITPSTAWTVETVDLNISATALSLSHGALDLNSTELDTDGAFLIDCAGNLTIEAPMITILDNMTFDGNYLTLIGTTNLEPRLILKNTGDGIITTPSIQFFQDSESPAGGDLLGVVEYSGKNAAGTTKSYFQQSGWIMDADDEGSNNERGNFYMAIQVGGTNSLRQCFALEGIDGDKVKFSLGKSNNQIHNEDDVDICVLDFPDRVQIGDAGTNEGILELLRKDSNEFPYIKMYSSDNTASYLFVADNGTLRIHSAAPTSNGDGAPV